MEMGQEPNLGRHAVDAPVREYVYPAHCEDREREPGDNERVQQRDGIPTGDSSELQAQRGDQKRPPRAKPRRCRRKDDYENGQEQLRVRRDAGTDAFNVGPTWENAIGTECRHRLR